MLFRSSPIFLVIFRVWDPFETTPIGEIYIFFVFHFLKMHFSFPLDNKIREWLLCYSGHPLFFW